jgi:hypothetical protein
MLALSSLCLGQTLQQQLDSGARYVQTPAGTITLTAPLTITTRKQVVDFSASTIVCAVDADCIVVGNPSDPYSGLGVTVQNLLIAPGVVNGTHAALSVYGEGTRVVNMKTAYGANGTTFGYFVEVFNDQAFTLDGLSVDLGTIVRCDATFCGSQVYAPGPFSTSAAVGWLTHLNLSPQCGGNGVDWQSGNTLKISDSVIQGYAQFGVRTGTRRGGYGGTELDNVYMEAGNCAPAGRNPLGNVGVAGIIHSDRAPRGYNPTFANTGSNQWLYFVAMNPQTGPFNSTTGAPWNLDSVPLYLGQAKTDGVTPITGTFPNVSGVAVYRVLRQVGYQQYVNASHTAMISRAIQTPPIAGATLVATVLASSCTSVCTFTDSMGTPASYTPVSPTFPNRDATFWPDIQFWPGDLVLTRNTSIVADESVIPYGHTTINPYRPGSN